VKETAKALKKERVRLIKARIEGKKSVRSNVAKIKTLSFNGV